MSTKPFRLLLLEGRSIKLGRSTRRSLTLRRVAIQLTGAILANRDAPLGLKASFIVHYGQ